jgi:hypothetical protein
LQFYELNLKNAEAVLTLKNGDTKLSVKTKGVAYNATMD